MSTGTYPFGKQYQDCTIKCLGCKGEFPGLIEYNGHDCPNPESGEAYL